MTPAPGLQGGGQNQQGVCIAAAPKRPLGGEEVERETKRQDTTESPGKSAGKREAAVEIEDAEKKTRGEATHGVITIEDDATPEEKSSDSKTRPADHETEGSLGGNVTVRR